MNQPQLPPGLELARREADRAMIEALRFRPGSEEPAAILARNAACRAEDQYSVRMALWVASAGRDG